MYADIGDQPLRGSLYFMCSIRFERIMCVLGLYIESLSRHNIDTADGNSHEGTQNGLHRLFLQRSIEIQKYRYICCLDCIKYIIDIGPKRSSLHRLALIKNIKLI